MSHAEENITESIDFRDEIGAFAKLSWMIPESIRPTWDIWKK